MRHQIHPYDQKRETESEADVNRRQIDEHLERLSVRTIAEIERMRDELRDGTDKPSYKFGKERW